MLLSYAPPELNTPLPSLAHLEHPQSQLLTKNGQHEIGDRRRCLQRELQLQIREEILESPSQGAVWRTDPQQCEEVRNLADEMGTKKRLLPALLTACWTENLADHFSFAGADIGPCRRCGQAEGATAAHLMVGDESAALRIGTLKPALISAFRSGAPNSTQHVSDDDIFTQLTHVPDVGPMKPGPAEQNPQSLYRHPDTGKLRGTCPKCNTDQGYSAPMGRLYIHNCVERHPDQGPETIMATPPANRSASRPPTRNNPQRTARKTINPQANCPKCGKLCAINLSGALHKHNCIPQPRPIIFQQPAEPSNSQEDRQPDRVEANAAAAAALDLNIHPKRIAMHKREQNARIIAVFTGVISTPAASFLRTHIPNPKARGAVIKKIRTAFLTFTYEAWIANKAHLQNNMLPKARAYLRRRAWRSLPRADHQRKRQRIHPADEAAWLIQPLDETAWQPFVTLHPTLASILPLYRTPEMLLRLKAGIRGADVEARKKAYLQLLQDSITASDASDDEDDDEEDLDDLDEEDDDATLVIEQAQDPGQEPQPRPPPHDPGPAPPPSTRKRTSRPSTDAN